MPKGYGKRTLLKWSLWEARETKITNGRRNFSETSVHSRGG